MDTLELDTAIAELETRVERLRALYEQYFLGIERLEPLIARKDVDRRIWQLRREKIRNTAKRFKLQTLIQRYNTLQMYWQRVCREIERGTYRRHVLRAERATTTVSDIVAQKEAERRVADARTTADDLADMLARDVDAEQEFARAVAEASAQMTGRTKPTSNPPRSVEALDLELDGMAAPQVPSATQGVNTGARGNLLAALGSRPGTGRANVAALVGPTPQRSGKLRSRTAAEPPSAPQAAVSPSIARPAEQPGVARAPAPAQSAPAAVARPLASAPRSGAVVPRAGAPEAAAPAPAAPPAAAAPPAPMRANPAPAAVGLTDQRIAELHSALIAAKQRINEGGKVSVDGLAKSLRAAESKLQAQHRDRRIDFDIVIKNGKAVVKPIVR